jgi:hypothetical protein
MPLVVKIESTFSRHPPSTNPVSASNMARRI